MKSIPRQHTELNGRIRDYLRAQGLTKGAQIPSERELAAALGVGRTALRPVLETLEGEGVLERRPQAGTFLRELPLPHGKGSCVALIAPFGEVEARAHQTEPMWLHRVVSAFERVMCSAGAEFQLLDQSPRADDACSIKEMAREAAMGGAQAVVLVHPLGSRCTISCALTLLHDLGTVPIIASARTYPGMASAVYFDSSWGVYRATRSLLERGHRKIGFIAGSTGHEWVRERIAGFEQALDAAELDGTFRWIWGVDEGERLATSQDGVSALEEWLRLPKAERPTALLAANDIIAVGLLNAARIRGVRVPDELSIIGFDNDPAALLAGLTTLERPTEALGESLARLTLDHLTQEHEQEASVTHRLLPALIERATVATPHTNEE